MPWLLPIFEEYGVKIEKSGKYFEFFLQNLCYFKI